MNSVVCMCAIVLLAAVSHANIVKGLYCRDPDTGKLYPVNTTWPSQSFCGNYTCKLRKKNITETEYAPIQEIDLTKFHIPTKEDMAISSSDISIAVTKKTDNDIQPVFHKDFLKSDAKDTVINDKDLKDNDGYLTESEIKTITDMLHTVKKSDLEAIVDIYNLAQDIYKEIDKVSTEHLTKSEGPEVAKKLKKVDKLNDQQSYWYDQAQYHNKLVDMSREETHLISTNKPLSDSNPTFFKGPLSDKDFGKLPYYYPISNFQRQSSYTHKKSNINDLEKAATETKPCTKPASNFKYVSLPAYNALVKRPEMIPTVKSSTLLPYPFSYIYHYNVSGYPPNYYYSYPWSHTEHNRQRNYPQPYYGTYIVQIPSVNPHSKGSIPVKEKSSELSNSGVSLNSQRKKVSEKKLPDWQTPPLSEKVIEEVRAHMDKPKTLKPIPLKKNIKLERVGKVIKLDELTRTKREKEGDDIINNIDEVYEEGELEAYIEKTICENSTEPGYFSVGNLSAPFPACCPRKLDSLHTARDVIKVN